MSKHSAKQQKNSQRTLYAAGGIGLVLMVALVMLLTRPTSAAELISPAGYQTRFLADSTAHFLLDVRTPEEFATGHIAGAVNIPVEALADRLSEVPNSQPVVIYCRSGNRSAQAARILVQAGYSSLYDLGGINDWSTQGFPVE